MGNLTDNRLDTILSDSDMAAISEGMAVIADKLPAISLTPAQRKTMKRIDVGNKVFAEKTLLQISLHGAGIIPDYISATRIQNDLSLYRQADKIESELRKLLERISDIKQVTGDEALTAALHAYKLFGDASRVGIPGAKEAHENLTSRFSSGGRKKGKDL